MTVERWLVIGANGALGTDLIEVLGERAIPATRHDFDLTHKEDMYAFIKKQPIIGVINTSAFHNVPLCEKQVDSALDVNVHGVKNLAELFAYLNVHLCHISTDYVFDGTKGKPYVETDLPSPLNTYAISKLAGEHMVQAYAKSYNIIRSCGLYGKVPTRAKGNNFVTNIVRQAKEGKILTVVNDEIVTPTCTHDLAVGISHLLPHSRQSDHQGIFHINQAGSTSWYDFAKVILNTLGFSNELKAVSRDEFPSTLNRPAYSVLDCSRFEALTGHCMASWEEALVRFLNTHRKQLI